MNAQMYESRVCNCIKNERVNSTG